ncbi:MAG: hypothetical protein E6G25_05710 [Actinobacteria bacterium]|nr:MAG: hypothetical protein E6G25_05710 [Actinomycetota bacterium]
MPRRSLDAFEKVSEQPEAKRLLRAALDDGLAHAYLFHGPPGVGKRALATAFAAELLGDARRVERGSHPDLYALEPLGDQTRIDAIRALRHDLHMRPFEADYRVYLIFGAHAMNEEAADALLKDLEEPPAYAVIVLVADELGSLPETVRSRCQPIPFRRLSERTVREAIMAQAPELPADEATAIARVAAGRLDRAALLLDDAARSRRGRPRGARADGAGDGAAAAPRRARRRARRVARGAGGNRCLVPRSRRLRGGRRDGSPLRPHRRAARGRLARAPRRRGAGGRARPRGLAQFCRVQRQCAVGAGGALRPPAPVVCGRKGRRLTLVVVTPVRPS